MDIQKQNCDNGGWSEIRTHGGRKPSTVFKTVAFNRSAIHPQRMELLYMTIEYNGRQILTDENGYLKNEADWSLDLMHFMAKRDGLTLTEEHILIINEVREYYKEFATTPPIRGLIRLLKSKGYEKLSSSITLAKLFPDGAAKSAAKYAGLPKPIKCIQCLAISNKAHFLKSPST